MDKKEEIESVLHRDLAVGTNVSDKQLSETAKEISKLPQVDESTLKEIGRNTVGDDKVAIFGSVDVGDINNILDKPEKK